MNKRIVILGAGFAGMMAALRLSRKLSKHDAEITLVNATDAFVERTRLHQFAAGQRPKTRSIPHMLRGARVQFVQGHATRIQPDQKQLAVETVAGAQTIGYDYLIYALGSRTDRERIPGLTRAYTLDAADAMRLADALPAVATRRGRVLVIGGGLTGIEAATEIAESFPSIQVALATRGALGDDLSASGGAHVRKVFDRLHIAVHDGAAITRVEADAAITASGERIPFDACINCAGFATPGLAREAGLAVNRAGQLLIDAFMRSTSHPEIYGAGDAAAFADEVRMPLRMACATALPMAVHAADNLAARLTGQGQRPFAFGYLIRCISLGRKDALVQTVDARDVPQPRVITGKAAVAIKEGILRSVTTALDMEKRFSLYRVPRVPGMIVAQTSARQPSPAVSLTQA